MAQPTAYTRATSFTNYQALNPTTPLPGSSVDQEFNRLKVTTDEILTNLELIQRDDGRLANDSVGLDQLSAEVTVGFNVPTVWVTGTAYTADEDTVFNGSGFYRCLTTHTSGTFATDLAADKWELIVDLSTIPLVDAEQIAFTPAGAIASTDVQAALEELDAEKAAVSHSHAATGISDSTAAGRALLTAADVAAQLAALGITGAVPTYGEMRPTAAITAPSLWLLCYGQAVSRTTYASLFAAVTISQTGTRTNASPVVTGLSDTANMRAGMPVSGTGIPSSTTILTVDSGTQITLSQNASSSGSNTVVVAPHGVGDGSTTFNIPDLRGRAIAGRDDMGGSAASRLTSTTVTGTQLGNTGGAQTHTLVTGELAAHTHAAGTLATASDGAHTHTITGWIGTNSAPISLNATSGIQGATQNPTTSSNGAHTHTMSGSTASAGSGTAHNNVQPTIVENYIIFAGV